MTSAAMKILLIAVCLLTTASVNAQIRTVWKQHELSGPVHSIRIETEQTDANAVTGARTLVQVAIFDERRNLIRRETHNRNGSPNLNRSWNHEYDQQDREIKTYYYDGKGALTNTGVTTYDTWGRAIQTIQINPNGSINHIRAYSYDEKGNNVSESHRNESGTSRNIFNRKFDEHGRVIEEMFLKANGSMSHRNVLTYDERGNQNGLTVFRDDGTVVQVFRKVFSYDGRGTIREVVDYGSDNSIVRKESRAYEFDDRGNWIRCRIARNGVKDGRSQTEVETIYRSITYF